MSTGQDCAANLESFVGECCGCEGLEMTSVAMLSVPNKAEDLRLSCPKSLKSQEIRVYVPCCRVSGSILDAQYFFIMFEDQEGQFSQSITYSDSANIFGALALTLPFPFAARCSPHEKHL
jgi:hypothetical protein